MQSRSRIPVLYFHGFASSPGSRKVELLRPLLPELELHVPDMNVPSFERLDWDAMVEKGAREGRALSPQLIVGSSLGSLLALEMARAGIVAPIVMIAPALGVAQRWTEVLPPDDDPILVYNHVTDGEEPIHRRFFEQMAHLEIDHRPPPAPVTVIMGDEDESVPFDMAFETWKSWEQSGGLVLGSRFVAIPGGDHGLAGHVERIAAEIRAAASTGEKVEVPTGRR